VKGGAAIRGHLRALFTRGRDEHVELTHNPLGALVVVLFLVLLLVAGGLGWFANDGVLFEGALAKYVSLETSDLLSEIHHRLAELIIPVVLVHVAAVLFYYVVKRDNLLWPMLTGKKSIQEGKQELAAESKNLWFVSSVKALVLFAIVAGAIWGTYWSLA
ncbi:MAG: cytochrome b/b6 domain-containing protein, partial [Alphaproteobacteria bacterium]|nr:cytochrome b/b6 domain-containing protein [Alphaproteobacteria bacterium]